MTAVSIGSWVKARQGTMFGRVVGYDLKRDEYRVVIPPTKTQGAMLLPFDADELVPAEAPK